MTGPSDEAPVVGSPDLSASPKPSEDIPKSTEGTLDPDSKRGDSSPMSSMPLRPASPDTTIEAEEEATVVQRPGDDDTNIIDDNDIRSTISVSSNAMSYRYENGRRYHAQNNAPEYFLPNDDIENDRLDLFHHLLTLRCDGRLHFAPIGPAPKRILDLGTGTGIWAIQMGDAYPSAAVLGNDLSPVQPNVVPPNVIFEVDDIESDWYFTRPFDYIHCRYLAGAIVNWPRLMEQAFKSTEPGGWVEFQDFDMKFHSSDGTFVPDCPVDEWTKECVLALESMDREAEPGPKLEKWVRDAGFKNVTHQCLPIPIGIWPKDRGMKEIGACNLSMFLEGLEAMSLRCLTTGRSWSRKEVLGFLPAVRRGLKDRRVHAMHDFHIVYAQKPFAAA